MFEIHRQAYLNALGIDNYVPKWQLPGAPESDACEFIAPEIDSSQPQDSLSDDANDNPLIRAKGFDGVSALDSENNPDANSPNVSNSNTNSPGAKSARDLIQEITNEQPKRIEPKGLAATSPTHSLQIPTEAPSETPQPEPQIPPAEFKAPINTPALSKKAPKPAVQALPKANSKKVQFSLNFWRISDELMVVDSRQVNLALPTEKLLVNMLFALGYPKELPKSEIIRWPLIDAPGQPQDENAARETLHAFLDEQFLLRPGKFMLLMGEDAAQYLLDSDLSFEEQTQQQHTIETFALTAIVTPNLAHLLQQPSAKADVWRAIQPLRQ